MTNRGSPRKADMEKHESEYTTNMLENALSWLIEEQKLRKNEGRLQ